MKKLLGIVVLGLLWCNAGFALDVESAKKTCKDIGYEPGTEKFADCALKLMTTNIDNQDTSSESQSADSSSEKVETKNVKLDVYVRTNTYGGSTYYHNTAQVTKGTNDMYNFFSDTLIKAYIKCTSQFATAGYNPADFPCLTTAIYYSEPDNASIKKQKFLDNDDGVQLDEIKIGWNGIKNSTLDTSIAVGEPEEGATVTVTSTSTQDQQYESTPEFVNVKKDKFYYKYLKKYMRTPESVLCISYINEYGWHKREKKQAIKFEVLETRGINCDPYMEAAYYDREKKDKAVRDAAKDAFDAGVGAAYGVSDSDSRANKRTRRFCIKQKVGKNLYKKTCR